MKKQLLWKSMGKIFGMILFFAILYMAHMDLYAAKDYKYGENILEWDDTVYISDETHVYGIKKGASKWDKIIFNGWANDYYAEGDTLYLMKNNESGCYLYSYDISRDEDEILRVLEPGSRLIGKIDKKVYYLEQDKDKEDYEGMTLKSYNLSTETEESLAGGIGIAKMWNDIIVMSGKATDVSPVKMVMMDKNEEFALVDENCGTDFYVGEEGFYYLRYEMTGDTSWSGVTLCTIDDSRKSIAKLRGEMMSAAILDVKDGYVDMTCTQNGTSGVQSVEVKTGQLYSKDVPVAGKIPSVYQDGEDTYYYSDYAIYYWKGAGYREVLSVPSDALIVGIADGYVYYWRYQDGEKELYQDKL